jgi:hypothetical protein
MSDLGLIAIALSGFAAGWTLCMLYWLIGLIYDPERIDLTRFEVVIAKHGRESWCAMPGVNHCKDCSPVGHGTTALAALRDYYRQLDAE